MPTVAQPLLDPARIRAHRWRNFLHSVLLIAGIGALTAFTAWLVWGPDGVLWAFGSIVIALILGQSVSPELAMRLFKARPVSPAEAPRLHALVAELAKRAELPAVPRLYVVPSNTLNAFAVGRPDKASIAVTEGLLRVLDFDELAGVLAHEISHIRNNDLWIMGLADTMSRFTQIMSSLGVFFLMLNFLSWFVGQVPPVPWLVAILLYIAPLVGSLLQLALSRAREFDADLEGAQLTGDPDALARALTKLEHYQGRIWEDMLPMGRRIPMPSVLRTHPVTEERVRRLAELKRSATPFPPLALAASPEGPLHGFTDLPDKRRYRITGVWY